MVYARALAKELELLAEYLEVNQQHLTRTPKVMRGAAKALLDALEQPQITAEEVREASLDAILTAKTGDEVFQAMAAALNRAKGEQT